MASVRFCKKLQFSVQFYKINCGFSFLHCVLSNVYALYCVQLSRFGITFVCRRHLSFMPLWYDARNDVLLCWICPTNCQPKWLRTRSAEIRHEEKYFDCWSIVLEDELWMRQCEKPSPMHQSRFLYTEPNCGNWVFGFWIFRSVWFLENWYPTFSSGSVHLYRKGIQPVRYTALQSLNNSMRIG